MAKEVKEITGGHGIDVVVEHVGEATWKTSLSVAAPHGRIAVCGATSGPNPPAGLNRIWWKQLSVLGSTMATRKDFAGASSSSRAGGQAHRRPVFPLADAAEAHRYLESAASSGRSSSGSPAEGS